MDPIEPILPDRPVILPVRAAQRAAPVHRDRGGGGGAGAGAHGEQHRRRGEEEAVEVDVTGLDLTAGDEPDPPAHRIDLSA